MQGVRATVRPCPCEARRSRIHMRVYGARHGRARRDLGEGVGRDNCQPVGAEEQSTCVSQCLLFLEGNRQQKCQVFPDGSGSRTRAMSACHSRRLFPLGSPSALCAQGTRAA